MTENRKKTGKARPGQFKPGQSGNPGGRPVNAVSLTAIVKRFAGMTPSAIADEVGQAASKLKSLGNQSNFLEIIAASFLYEVARDPQPGNMRELWRRIDGEVPTPTMDVDLNKLSDEQLEMLANGADIITVLTATRSSGEGTAQETEGEPASE